MSALAALAAAAVLVLLLRPRPVGARPARTATVRVLPSWAGWAAGAALAGCLLAAGAGWAALPAGAIAGAGLRAVLRRAVPRAVAEARGRVADELPWALDLLAAASVAGTPPSAGLDAVAAALGPGELGPRLAAVAAQLRLGAPPDEAWSVALDRGGEALAPVCEAYAASAADGSRLAARLAAQATAVRERSAAAALSAAERAGVRAVLPLGLCYLPAFVLVGIAPVVAAALHRL